jgi:hypothetical protein
MHETKGGNYRPRVLNQIFIKRRNCVGNRRAEKLKRYLATLLLHGIQPGSRLRSELRTLLSGVASLPLIAESQKRLPWVRQYRGLVKSLLEQKTW